MKILVASDIHGSYACTEKLIEAFKREGAERMLFLGDILYHGPRNCLPEKYDTKDVANLLNQFKNDIYSVRGNCDAEVDQLMLEFPIMADYCIISVGKKYIFATHGHRFNKDNLPPMHPGDILLHGHTHISVCEEFGEYVYCNPGSVSIPKGGTPAGYMIIDEKCMKWKTLDGEEYREYIF